MCVSIANCTGSRAHRRCKITEHTRAAATASRRENRATIRYARENVRSVAGDPAASAVGALPPAMLSNLVVSLEAVQPGIGAKILRSPTGAQRRVPGMHNNVFTENREHTGAAEKANRGKFDPKAISKVQLASALTEKGLIERGAIRDPLEASAEMGRIETRIDAVASGVMTPPPPGTRFDELPEPAQKFYARHTLDEVSALTVVQQRVSDKLFEDVTYRAQVAASPRRPAPVIAKIGGERAHVLTAAELLQRNAENGGGPSVEIANGVTLTRGTSGDLNVVVEGLRLPVDGDARVHEVLSRIPAVDFDKTTKVPAGGTSSGLNVVVQSMLTGTSPRAQSMRTAARRRIIERAFYGDTGMSYTADADGHAQLLAGKARAHTADALASRPHSSRHDADDQAQTTRLEGFDLSRNLRFAREARRQFLAGLPREMKTARAPEAKMKRYHGDVTTEDRAAAAKSGFQVRHRDNTIDTDYPAARAALEGKVHWDQPTAVSTNPPGMALSQEHLDVRAGGARMVAEANQLARFGRNPELVPASALIAEAKLGEAFEVWNIARTRDRSPRVLTAVHPVPSAYRGREAEFVASVFPQGGAFTTKGYTMARSDGASARGAGRVRVQYLTTDGMPVQGGDVIATGTTFRVLSTSTAEDGTIEVRAVADQVAAGIQQRADRRKK